MLFVIDVTVGREGCERLKQLIMQGIWSHQQLTPRKRTHLQIVSVTTWTEGIAGADADVSKPTEVSIV